MTTYWRRTAATRMSSAAPRPAPTCYHERQQEEQQEKENNNSRKNCWTTNTSSTTGNDHEQQCQRNFTCSAGGAAPTRTNPDACRIVYQEQQEEDNKNNDSTTNQRRHILRSTGVVSAAAAVGGVLADAEFKKMPAATVVEDDDEVADVRHGSCQTQQQQEQEQECNYHQQKFLGGRGPVLLVERTAQSVSRRGDTSSHEDAPSFGGTGQAQQQLEQQYGTTSMIEQPCVMATNIETAPCTTMQSMEHHDRAPPSSFSSTNEGNGFMSQSIARLSSSPQQEHQGHYNPFFEISQHHHLQHHFATSSTPHTTRTTFYPYSPQAAGSPGTVRHSSFDNQGKTKTRTAAPQQGHRSTKGNTLENSCYHQQEPSSSYSSYSSSENVFADASKSCNNPLGAPPLYGPQYASSKYHTTCTTPAVTVGDYQQTTRTLQPPHYTYPYHPFTAGNSSVVNYAPHGHFPMHPYYDPHFATQHPNHQNTHPEYLFHGSRTITAASSAFTSANSISKLTGTTISAGVNTNSSSNNAVFLSDIPDSSLQTARQREDDPSNTGSLDSPTGGNSNKNTSAKKKRKKKPKDCPRRPLSAYNFFFKDERKKILESIPSSSREQTKSEDDKIRDSITWPGKKRPPHGKIGFENLAKVIGERWKSVDSESMKYYKDLATQDLQRYAEEMKVYEEKQEAKRKSNADANGTNRSSDNEEDDEGDITRSRHTNQEDNVQCKEKHNKRKISISTHGQEVSLKDEVVSSQLKNATNKKRKSPTVKRRSKTNNKPYHDEYYQDTLEVEEILPQDIDQDDPLINFDAASVFVNSFSFDNEDMTSSNKNHHGNNSNSSVKGIPFTESWLVDSNHSESS